MALGLSPSRRSCALLLVLCGLAAAQQAASMAPVTPQAGELHIPPNTRVIKGLVTDAHGAAVPGAIVLLKDTKTLQVRSYIAQADGAYRFYGLSTDVNYQVRAETNEMNSPTKLVSVFDSKKVITVNLKIKKKKKRENS